MEKVKLDHQSLGKHKEPCERTVEVELPINFKTKGNEILIELLFSNEKKTGGGEIESLTYLEDQHKAIIVYEEASVAQRVLQKKEIPYSDYRFQISSKSLFQNEIDKTNGNYVDTCSKRALKNIQNCLNNEIDSKPTSESVIYPLKTNEQIETNKQASANQMLLKLYKNNIPLVDMQRYAENLTEQTALSSQKIDRDSCLINFPSKIDQNKVLDNYLEKNKSLPAGFEYKIIDSKEPIKSSQLNDISTEKEVELPSCSSDCKMILIKNVPKTKPKSIVEFYCYNLVQTNVVSAKIVDESQGNWLVEFEKKIDFEKLVSNFNKNRKNYPPSMQLEPVRTDFYNKNKPLKNNIRIEEIKFSKTLANNTFLRLILFERNKKWREDLIEKYKSEKETLVTIDQNDFVVTCADPKSVNNKKSWITKMDKILCDYFKNFYMEKLKYKTRNDYDLLKPLTKKIDDIRKLYLIDYFHNTSTRELFIISTKIHMEDFFERNPLLRTLANTYSVKNNENETRKSILIKLNQFDTNIYDFLCKTMIKLVEINGLKDFTFDEQTKVLTIFGVENNVNKTIELLEKNLTNLRKKKLNLFSSSENFCYIKNADTMIAECMKTFTKSYFYDLKVDIKDGKLSNIYLIYFTDFKELDSVNDNVYKEIFEFLSQNLTFYTLDVTKYIQVIVSDKWLKFEKDALCTDGHRYSINKITADKKMVLLIYGFTKLVTEVKQKIEKFLESNDAKRQIMEISQEDYNYLKHVSQEWKKRLETKYNVKMSLNDLNGTKTLEIDSCTSGVFDIIETEIIDELYKKKIKLFATRIIPGLRNIIENVSFKHDIEKIEEDTFTSISLKPSNKLDSIQLADIQNYKSTSETTKDPSLNIIDVNKSKICFEIGDITDTKADVIVNVTNPALNLLDGVLSVCIARAAGPQLPYLIQMRYPNGIKVNEIATTPAGQLSKASLIYHITCPTYSNDAKSWLDSIIKDCLKSTIEKKLNSIAFPLIGTGKLCYPSQVVAQVSLNTVYEFLRLNTDKALEVKFVAFKTDLKNIKTFEEEFESFKQTHSNLKTNKAQLTENTCYGEKESSSGKFEIVYKYEKSYEMAVRSIQKLINEKYLSKDEINDEKLSNLKDEELKSISRKYEACEIKHTNGKLEFFGLKEDVLKAKLEVMTSINRIIFEDYSKFKHNMTISKNVQWQFEKAANQWENFSIYLNSLIETEYAQSKSHAKFLNEDNEYATINFNVNPIVYVLPKGACIARRLDINSQQDPFSYPTLWSSIPSGKDFDIIAVKQNTAEYTSIHTDFVQKLGRTPTKVEIQRIENKHLFRQFLIQKDKFKSKQRNDNEMQLYHGTAETSIDSICRFGFNRSYCGKNGVSFGQGVYFAVNSSLSDGFTIGSKKMFRVRVLVGDSCIGNSSMKVPSHNPNTGEPYDSTTDNAKSLYVCYHDNQCYPEYLISYA